MLKVKINGGTVLVDAEDYDKVRGKAWYLSHNGYAVHRFRVKGGMGILRMHRLINETPDQLLTDHINGNRLDNRRSNLRSVTPLQNMQNRKDNLNNRSGARGVSREPNGKWRARIQHEGKKINLGNFQTLEDAERAYGKRARELWPC